MDPDCVVWERDTVYDWCSVGLGRHLRNAGWCFGLARKRGVSDCCLRDSVCVSYTLYRNVFSTVLTFV